MRSGRGPRAGHCCRFIAGAAHCGAPRAQQPTIVLGPFDLILDTYVRDGYVYYRALKDRTPAARRVRQTDRLHRRRQAPEDEQMAFWLNAYNALVLRTVIDGYPAPRRSTEFPAAQHPPDAGRLRAADPSRRRPDADARSDRADDPAEVRRPPAVLRARPRRGRAAAGFAARPLRPTPSRSSWPRSPASASRAPSAFRSTRRRTS